MVSITSTNLRAKRIATNSARQPVASGDPRGMSAASLECMGKLLWFEWEFSAGIAAKRSSIIPSLRQLRHIGAKSIERVGARGERAPFARRADDTRIARMHRPRGRFLRVGIAPQVNPRSDQLASAGDG
jgi:hypothetical protein